MNIKVKTNDKAHWIAAPRGLGPRAFTQMEVVGLPAHGVIPITMLPNPLVPLVVRLTRSPDFNVGDQMQLHFNSDVPGQGIGPILEVLPTDQPNQVYTFEIPVDQIPPLDEYTDNLVDYEIGDIFSGSAVMSELPVRVIFDRLVPGGREEPPPLLFTDPEPHEITLVDLVNDILQVLAAAWDDMRVGDILTPWLGTGPLEADGKYLAPMPAVTAGQLHRKFPVEFTGNDIRANGNVVQYFGYKLEDLAGNVSLLSVVIHANVLLTDPPANLTAPTVPANADGIVSDTDVRPTPVVVEIPRYDNAAPGDWITVIWGTIEMPAVQLDSSHFPGTPGAPLISISLPYSDVARGPIKDPAVPVTYKVRVGTIEAGTSPAATISVDLSTPGGIPDPDPTTPWHEDLAPPTLKSNSGQTNIIPIADFKLDATIEIPRLGVQSGLPVWARGDEVYVTYNTTELAPVTISGANEANDPLIVTLPFGTIAGVGPGTFNISYRIRRALTPATTPPQFSTAYSSTTSVIVHSDTEYPNEGRPLAVVSFPEAKLVQGNYYIQRNEGADGTDIRIPVIYPNVAAGATLDLRFVGIVGFNNPTGADIPNTEVIIPPYTITPQDITNGYARVEISAEILLRICNKNGSKTTYSISNAAGPTNGTETFMNIAVEHKNPAIGCIFPVPTP